VRLPDVRLADIGDAERIGALLHDFNTEFDDLTPGAEAMAARVGELMREGELDVLVAGADPVALAVLRFRPSLWRPGALDAYLEELYVVPGLRGHGIGRALMRAAIDLARERGARDMHLCTSEDDVAARRLYESLGFINRERGPDGPVAYFYEREL